VFPEYWQTNYSVPVRPSALTWKRDRRRKVADFISKYSIACKEARETHYWLRLLAESELVHPERLVEIEKECDELIAILTSIVKKMRAKNK